MRTIESFLQELRKRTPDKRWSLAGIVGNSRVDYYMYRNKLPPEARSAPIYKVACANIDAAIINGKRIEINGEPKIWQVNEAVLKTSFEDALFQIMSESKGFIQVRNRVVF